MLRSRLIGLVSAGILVSVAHGADLRGKVIHVTEGDLLETVQDVGVRSSVVSSGLG